MDIEEQLLSASLENTFDAAYKCVRELGRLYEGNTPHNLDEGEHADAIDGAMETLEFYVKKAFRDVSILAERLRLPNLVSEILAARNDFESLHKLEMEREDPIFYSPPLQAARAFFDSLQTMTQGRGVSGLGIFESILRNTARLIEDRNIQPDREAEVRNAVLQVLGYAFTDAVKDPGLGHFFKTYRPDIGVRSLMAVAEYKFVRSSEELKQVLDSLMTDMKGYRGHVGWRSFYAVIYMDGAYATQSYVDEVFRIVDQEKSWTPILVTGKSRTKVKNPKPSSSGGSD